ncbi:MAG: LuxR C-terminal-related transcriptional regulator [Verrucomicrobiota bacterium]
MSEEYRQAASAKTPRFTRAGRPLKKIAHLTPREREVLQQIANGWANKQIAADLGISIKTIEKHRQSTAEPAASSLSVVCRAFNLRDT